MQAVKGSYDVMWSTVTMDNGVLVSIGGGWNLPPSYRTTAPRDHRDTGMEAHCSRTIRSVPTGSIRSRTGRISMSTMPGEWVDHVYAGQMGPETMHFLECVLRDEPPMVVAGGRASGDGNLSRGGSFGRIWRTDQPPLDNQALSAIQDLYKKFRAPGLSRLLRWTMNMGRDLPTAGVRKSLSSPSPQKTFLFNA